ncbi:MAG: citrate synthase [Anaerolineae bacterium]|nr:citrate synthase [Anaerolineae bacterium]
MPVPVKAGLEGVVAAESQISAVDGLNGTLSYRGIDIGQFAQHATYEETVYLLWTGKLPTRVQLTEFAGRMVAEREIDESIQHLLTIIPRTITPINALRTAVSALSGLEEDTDDRAPEVNQAKALRLTAKFPTIVASYHRCRLGLERVAPDPDLSHAANFLYMLHGKRPTPQVARAMDLIMLLLSDHGFNASTFAARVTASTLSDMYAAVTTALGTLKGPLHGGANHRSMQMLLEIGSIDNAEPYIDAALAEKRRIMGFGHRVYRQTSDPRCVYVRRMLYEVCEELGDMYWYELAVTIEEMMAIKRGLFPNVDFYSAPLMYLLGLPLDLFVPLFAISRVPGWTAHIMEQYEHNRLFRPVCAYTGYRNRAYVPIEER